MVRVRGGTGGKTGKEEDLPIDQLTTSRFHGSRTIVHTESAGVVVDAAHSYPKYYIHGTMGWRSWRHKHAAGHG